MQVPNATVTLRRLRARKQSSSPAQAIPAIHFQTHASANNDSPGSRRTRLTRTAAQVSASPPVRSELPASSQSRLSLRAHTPVVSRTRGGTAGNTYPGSFDCEIVKKNTVKKYQDSRNQDIDPFAGRFRRNKSTKPSTATNDHGKIERKIIGP